jgi:hypothetical protein
VKRRDVLVTIAASGAAAMLPACSGEAPTEGLSDVEMRGMLRLNGMDLGPGEGAAIRASFVGSRFPAAVDPTIQPQSDFDADVDV